MKWKIRTAAYEDIRSLQERFNLNLVSAKVLAGRGITDAGSAKFYLEGDISFLHNPFMFEDMETFAERILRAVEEKEKSQSRNSNNPFLSCTGIINQKNGA